MIVARDGYLKQLIDHRGDGQVKVITGIRRCGKSFLLHTLFREWLIGQGVPSEAILVIELDSIRDLRFRDPLVLANFVRGWASASSDPRYLFVDEIQLSERVPNPYVKGGEPITFYDALNDLRSIPNLDVYVTGSSSRLLSSEIATNFRGRGDPIRVHPFSFREFHAAVGGEPKEALTRYLRFGGMPQCVTQRDDAERLRYLRDLVETVYLRDILERRDIRRPEVMARLFDILCSAIGSLTNPKRLTDAFNSAWGREGNLSRNTLVSYLDALRDAFLFTEAARYDVRGKRYLAFPVKYYCEDVGLRNARLGFRQTEEPHLLENIVHNELLIRGYAVDVGVVESTEGKRCEIDFIASRGTERLYIQTAFAMPTDAKRAAERRPLRFLDDVFPRIILSNDLPAPERDPDGILHLPILDFLLHDRLPL